MRKMAMNREEIVAAAIQRLNRVPTSSMAELAEAVGVSRATLHRHFSTREELLTELANRSLDSWEQAIEAAGVAAATASGDAEQIRRTLEDLLSRHLVYAEEHGFALSEHVMVVDPHLERRIDELEEREIELFAAGQRAGVIRADLPARWVSSVVYGLLVAARQSILRGDVARRDLPRIVIETLYRGIS
ncbi:TetR/AcrR family transcriptional regulator [Nonomuraea longicatena]|uniref:TetR/AcrR family transcriptional regulator n=1 Tax=Nonomuraea longicatena TaxID=83682 RepID=A0ABP3Z6P5_9ACTN